MMIIFGILFAVLGIMVCMKAARVRLLPFLLTTREVEGTYLSVGEMRILGGRRHKKAKKVKVKVEDSIVLEIIDELGALILNSNN